MNSSEERFKAKQKHNNFIYLFLGLLMLLVVAPVIIELQVGRETLIFQMALDATLILGIWSVVNQRLWFVLGLVLSLIGVSITVIDSFLQISELKLAGYAVVLPFYTLTAVLALRYILSPRENVDFNILMGAICVYMLMGIIWAIVYSFLEFLMPGSFSGLKGVPETLSNGHEFFYYSFVTLTTLGYGDLLPVSPIARSLAYLEALIGQIYVAVLIASLVGIHLSDRDKARASGNES